MGVLSVLLLGWGEEPAVVSLDLKGGAQALVCGGPHLAPYAVFQLAEVRAADVGFCGALVSAEAELLAAGADCRPVHRDGGLGSLHALKVAHRSRWN
jgi:hypothetical protein